MSWFELWLRPWQAQETSRFAGDVVEVGKTADLTDDVEEVAVIARGCISPFASRALARFATFQPNEERAAGRVPYVADEPIAAFAATVGKIVAAHRLGIARETERQFSGVTGHGHVTARSTMRESG